MPRECRAQRGERRVPGGGEFAPQLRVARELAQHLAGEQQAFLVEEDVALLHRTALVLLLEDEAAGRGAVHAFRAAGQAEVRGDLRIGQARELDLRQPREELPARFHALLERARPRLRDDRLLERGAEREIDPVGFRESLLADDAREDACLHGPRVRRVELARQRGMIRMRVLAAGAVLHQPRQARQHVDRRIDAAPVEIARQHDLPLGDVAGEVGDRMADVVGRHRQDRELRQRPFARRGCSRRARTASRGPNTCSRGIPCGSGSRPSTTTPRAAPPRSSSCR